MDLRIEQWDGHAIRFVGQGDNWNAIGKDVTDALGYQNGRKAIKDHVAEQDWKLINLGSVTKRNGTHSNGGSPVMLVISEFGIYSLIFSSKMPQARDFQRWTYKVLKQLRLTAGLEGYQAFRMLDKRVQQQSMARLEALNDVDYIKANTITNKAISNKYGLAKMVKKADMTPAMLKDRPGVLNDVVNLMNMKNRFGLDVSVSKTIYQKMKEGVNSAGNTRYTG